MLALLNLTDHTSKAGLPPPVIIGFYMDPDPGISNQSETTFDKSVQITDTFLNDSKVDFQSYELRKMPGGKPYLWMSDHSIGVSISHTHQFYLIGLNQVGEIGVDVERSDRKVHPKLGNRIKNTSDRFINDISTLQIWTIKEAVLKLTGSGLRTNMNIVAVHQKSDTLFDVFHENYAISVVSFEQFGCWTSVAWTTNN